ncbi:AraC family transcriptional regulator [Mycolicibacter arupensis]|uniref:AraC family transcriptional regulator n=1 Tax=Mycolicibacter arupensis TaxID=342002 RepID=A0A0F5N1A7_9MYCO|nr:AraC family transcriptional regulator [Mycolicibacter arupensis]KKC00670.1 AraC family transcriptional regulator [Mycolicibacter arupensis]MCV7276784.1 AraC family transcriptional regulator [Mycolicibacter arupensis]OQZ96854.1 AraC family transcriptional regulator [Mycolicibacter arupensis]
MSVVRGTALSGYPDLVTELGGDPAALLRAAGVPERAVGTHDVFVPYLAVILAVEGAASATGTPDFGRRLALRQDIGNFGPLGVAARTAATVGGGFSIVERFLSAYSPAISARIIPGAESGESFYAFGVLIERSPPHPQTTELSLGVSLGIMRMMFDAPYAPLSVHLPHEALTPVRDYLAYFGCRPYFAQPVAGFTFRSIDLDRPLHRDDQAHQAMVRYLQGITAETPGISGSVRAIVRQLLPTGTVNLELVAGQLGLHPKALHRRLAAEQTTFAALVDGVRRDAAHRYLRDTDISLAHLTRELGYAEQSVLSRSCQRWFGCSASSHRRAIRESLRA